MSLAALFISSFLVGLTGAMVPGPMLSVTMERTCRHGWVAGPLVVLGHGLLELSLIAAVLAGLDRILTSPLIAGVVGIFGGMVLLWLGIDIIRRAGTVTLPQSSKGKRTGPGQKRRLSWLNPTAAGVTTSLSNPYWLLWWGSVGAGYIQLSMHQAGAIGVITFFAGHISSDLVWFTAVAALMAAGGHRLPLQAYRVVLRVLGVFLLVMAGYFVCGGIGFLAPMNQSG